MMTLSDQCRPALLTASHEMTAFRAIPTSPAPDPDEVPVNRWYRLIQQTQLSEVKHDLWYTSSLKNTYGRIKDRSVWRGTHQSWNILVDLYPVLYRRHG